MSVDSSTALLEPTALQRVDSGGVSPVSYPSDLSLSSADRSAVTSRLTLVVGLVVAAAVVVLGVLDRARLDAGTDTLAGCAPGWLLVGAVGVFLIWIAGAATQLGAMAHRPPLGRLFAVQIAGSFANHLLPAGTGGVAINVRFLRRQGLSRQTALAAQALNHVAGVIAHLVLFTAALFVAPRLVHDAHPGRLAPRLSLDHALLISLVVGLAFVAGARLRWVRRHRSGQPSGSRVLRGLRNELPLLAGVLRNPTCGLQLWLGSFLTPLVQAGILVAVAQSLSLPMPIVTVVVVYLVACTVSGLIPSPGGLGALDVTLTAGLIAGGASAGLAVGAVMLYRLITVWVPLIPGALVLGVLVRRRII